MRRKRPGSANSVAKFIDDHGLMGPCDPLR